MKIRTILIYLLTAIAFHLATGQNTYDLKPNDSRTYSKCSGCLDVMKSIPKEILFAVQHDEENNIYFIMTDRKWFDKLFNGSGDGIAVDIIVKDQYDCAKETNVKNAWPSKGILLQPVYLKELKKNALPSQYGEIMTRVGELPEELRDKEIEYNFLIIRDRYVCYYYQFYGIKRYKWDLLDMGMYMDSLVYRSAFDTTGKSREAFILRSKRMKFTVPFEKDKYQYSPEDVKPVYDSLNLTDYTITGIGIRAYSSVEGPQERNIMLQENRAKSIAAALQSYQTPEIQTQIQASENWVDFYSDIANTPYSYLSSLSKNEIKDKLKEKNLSEAIEPVLKNHRKAVLIIDLEKKDKLYEYEPGKLISEFDKSIGEKNLTRALEIQNSVFRRIMNQKLPSDFINKMEIPRQKDFLDLLKHKATFSYMMNLQDVNASLKEFTELLDLMPDDGHIRYNLVVLKFYAWIAGENIADPSELKKEIEQLAKYGIYNNLVKRMLVNYQIIMSEYYMYLKDYPNKDKSLKYIKNNYKLISMTDQDLLSLAQYFVSYALYDWATQLLLPYVSKVDVDEDLLFYYLNLTIVNEAVTKKSSYRTIMLNAINLNKKRYCSLFDPYGEGGVTFQLLENEYLKRTYCENCE